MRFRLVIAYDGTDYHGWQIQPNGRSIQATLQEAIARMTGESTSVVAAGRTDAGVHASAQVISFALQRPVTPEAVVRGLNALTPPDIAIQCADTVADDFHPRRAATTRVYVYRIWNAPWQSPFWRRYAWHVRNPLQDEPMRKAAAALIGEHDFRSFQAAGCQAKQPVRRVFRSELARRDPLLTYTIEANGFLRHMVRNIVGTLVEIGSGARDPDNLPTLFAARDRTQAGPTAPARGLCLTQVNY
ncbi:MAG: tRNA pseudouridine(38-40) synthase TruA [Candidatus Binatia bacterium]